MLEHDSFACIDNNLIGFVHSSNVELDGNAVILAFASKVMTLLAVLRSPCALDFRIAGGWSRPLIDNHWEVGLILEGHSEQNTSVIISLLDLLLTHWNSDENRLVIDLTTIAGELNLYAVSPNWTRASQRPTPDITTYDKTYFCKMLATRQATRKPQKSRLHMNNAHQAADYGDTHMRLERRPSSTRQTAQTLRRFPLGDGKPLLAPQVGSLG